MSNRTFRPTWVSSPGETIADVLGERKLSLSEFATQMGCTSDLARELLDGRATISIGVARGLCRVLGASVEFWIARDYEYRGGASNESADEKKWLAGLPLGDMIRFGWLRPTPKPREELGACLEFFGVSNLGQWRDVYASLREVAAFRTSRSFDSRPGALAAWLRQGEIEGVSQGSGAWDPVGFESVLQNARALTRQKKPGVFLPRLRDLCTRHGVAVAIVRAPTGCRASGATRFLSTGCALIQLSFRHLTDDQFWFSFFHEAGHLLLHDRGRVFVEEVDTPQSVEEDQANEFAAGILVPREFQTELSRLNPAGREVISFARRVGVAPGIVVGQLQHLRRIGHNRLNSLKRRYRWD